ncbi:MAG: molybdopterin-binding protein, partial [Acidobacteriota bacterium]
ETTRTAAALVIGNELLTGKIQDLNIAVLAKELFGLGVELRRVVMCGDEVEVIAADLNLLRSDHDVVFTSGGVGPTHDDVTVRAVARAFNVGVVRSRRIEALLRGYLGDRCTQDHLRMADIPDGADLVSSESVQWPTVRMGNVYVLPGLPEVFAMKMATVRAHVVGGAPFVSRSVPTSSDEGAIASLLETLVDRFPGVAIGSYPRWGDGPVRVTVSFDGRDAAAVERAAAAFVAALPPDQLVAEPGA